MEKVTLSRLPSNLRRFRGYNFEHSLVKRLNINCWNARRLGGSSTGLPDIVAVNNVDSILLTIEAKCGSSDILYVPNDQIERCFMIKNMFSLYRNRHCILAFKFMRKKRCIEKGKMVYQSRKLIEYYKLADSLEDQSTLSDIKCTYNGEVFTIGSDTIKLDLPDYVMPFCNLKKQINNENV